MIFGFDRGEFWTATPAELWLLEETHAAFHPDPAKQPRPAGNGQVGSLLSGMLTAKQGASGG